MDLVYCRTSEHKEPAPSLDHSHAIKIEVRVKQWPSYSYNAPGKWGQHYADWRIRVSLP